MSYYTPYEIADIFGVSIDEVVNKDIDVNIWKNNKKAKSSKNMKISINNCTCIL